MPHAEMGLSFVSIAFVHALGDLDIVLYDSSGQALRQSAGVTNSERISLNGLATGTYFLRVYGYRGAHNPAYSMTIDPGHAPEPSSRVLYLNFDGATLTRSDLLRYSSDWSASVNSIDLERDGIVIQSFLQNTPGEQYREQVVQNVTEDLAPFNVSVHFLFRPLLVRGGRPKTRVQLPSFCDRARRRIPTSPAIWTSATTITRTLPLSASAMSGGTV